MDPKETVIIVDDDESLLYMLKEALVKGGYACEAATRAAAALKQIEKTAFDFMITDIIMPGMKGLELTEKAKQLRPEMIVIVMTGYIEDFSYDQAIEAGASDFIKKPFTIYELLMRIKHVKMQERLRAMSITDELTGLLNRRGFFALAQQQLKVVSRTKGDLALLFVDIDDFKTINDTWGHHAGDEALTTIAGIFKQTFRESDIVARMSGDEFAVLLLDTPERNFTIIQHRLQKNLDAYNAQKSGGYRLAISMGVAVYQHEHRCSIDELLKQADAVMYEQKQRKKSGAPLRGRE